MVSSSSSSSFVLDRDQEWKKPRPKRFLVRESRTKPQRQIRRRRSCNAEDSVYCPFLYVREEYEQQLWPGANSRRMRNLQEWLESLEPKEEKQEEECYECDQQHMEHHSGSPFGEDYRHPTACFQELRASIHNSVPLNGKIVPEQSQSRPNHQKALHSEEKPVLFGHNDLAGCDDETEPMIAKVNKQRQCGDDDDEASISTIATTYMDDEATIDMSSSFSFSFDFSLLEHEDRMEIV